MKFRTIFLFVVLAMLMLAGVAWAEDDVGGSGTVSAPGSLPVIEDLFLNDNGELIIKGSNLYTEEAFPIVTVDGYPIKVIHKSPTQLIVQLNAAQEGITTVTVITHPNDNNVVLDVIRTATAFIDTACDDKGCTQLSLVYDDILHSHIQPNYLFI